MPDASQHDAARQTTTQDTGRQHRERDRLPIIVVLLGALSWTILFRYRLSLVPEGFWLARDDAVITLSHARNWADFGSIGVSPGDRVEGFSTPLFLAVAAAVFRVVSLGYETFSKIFVGATIASIGALVALVVYLAARAFGNPRRRSAWMAVILTVVVAGTTVSSWTAAGWMVSGMENPLVVIAALAAAVFALSNSSGGGNTVGAIVALAMLGTARVDFAAFIVPVVAAVTLVQAQKAPRAKRRLVFLLTLASPLAMLAAVHVARRIYFGAWLPNTALAQGRAQGRDQIALLACISLALVAWLLHTALARVGDHKLLGWARAASAVGGVTFSGLAIWMTTTGRSKGSLAQLLTMPTLLLLVAALVLALRLIGLVDRRPWTPNFVLGGLVLIPLAQFLAMGPARLEKFRIASIAVPLLATWVAVLATRLVALSRPPAGILPSPGSREAGWMLAPVVIMLMCGLVWTESRDGPRYLPFGIGDSKELLAVADAVRESELGGVGLPILANPDLGKLSFVKKVFVVDLGLLGDPMMTQLAIHRRDLIVDYLNDVAAPDVVESHGTWSCGFGSWLRSESFRSQWQLSDDRWLARKPFSSKCVLDGRYAVWRRVNADPEYALTREVAASRRPESVVRAAVERCAAEAGSSFRCQHVRRAVQRNVQELRERGRLGAVVSEFRASPSAEMDKHLVARGPNWGVQAFKAYVRLAG